MTMSVTFKQKYQVQNKKAPHRRARSVLPHSLDDDTIHPRNLEARFYPVCEVFFLLQLKFVGLKLWM